MLGDRVQIAGATGLRQLAGGWVPDQAGQGAGQMDQAFQINPRLQAHGLQHVYGVFRANVATGPWRIRTAAQTAEGSIKACDARLDCGKDVGQPHASRVVKVHGQLQPAQAGHDGICQ